MSRIVLLSLVLGCAACGTAGPVVPDGPPSVASPPPEIVAPPPVLSALEPPPPPAPLPEAPRGSLTERRAYPRVGVTEWTLANGLGVVYKRLPEASAAFLSVAAPGGLDVGGGAASGDGTSWEAWADRSQVERWTALPDPSLPAAVARAREALAGAPPRSITVVLVGPWPEDDVESVVGHGLADVRTSGGQAASGRVAPVDGAWTFVRVPLRWSEVPDLLVLAAGLEARGGVEARVGIDPREGTLALGVRAREGSAGLASALRPFDAEDLARARRQALDDWGPDAPAGWGRMLQALWAEPGEYRPARDPSVVGRVLTDLVRVSPDAVEDLLSALRASARSVTPR